MIKRTLLYLAPVATTLGPVAYFAGPDLLPTAQQAGDEASSLPEAVAMETAAAAVPPPLPPENWPAVYDLAEVVRMDVSPGWVVQRWPRVSVGLAHVQLQGYRVPLVTGTADTDVAGALTYYFNAGQQVQRLTLKGTTGDATNLVYLLSSRFGFTRRVTSDPGVFVYEGPSADRKASNRLVIRPAGVIDINNRFHRFQVDLTLERPEA
jgi:hypothetical protein